MDRSPQLLVVDDDATIRELLLIALREAGYETDEAADGLEALQLVRVMNYDIIVLDWQMPRMDGCAFLDAYARLPGPHAAIILCTALAATTKANGIAPAGYLCKPFSLGELYDVVHRAWHRSSST